MHIASTRYVGAEIEQFFHIVKELAGRMDAPLGDLLDAGRIEARTHTVDREPAPTRGATLRRSKSSSNAAGCRPS